MRRTPQADAATKELTETRLMLLEAEGRQLLAVLQARRAGLSWAAIGKALCMSRQAAHERFNGYVSRHLPLTTPDGQGPSVTDSLFLEPKGNN